MELEEKVAAALSQACAEEGVCPEVPPGVKHARYLHRDDGKHAVLTCLWEDGAISSCTMEEKEVKCCHTEKDGGEEAYFAWVAHLAGVGYKEVPVETEGKPNEALV